MNNIILPPPAAAKPAEAGETEKLYTLFREYYDAYAAERARLDRCERMYRGDHWGDIPQKDAGEPRPVTPIIQSTVENVRADLIDYLPEAIISADSREYDELAELMTRIIRENHLRCAYDDEYAKLTHDLLVGGYSVQQVGFDPDANGGIGGAYIKPGVYLRRNGYCDAFHILPGNLWPALLRIAFQTENAEEKTRDK